ncbi:hypothetical protein BX667DRAFT_508522 [Coemansia mojavensis]|nr:hypothetical protein BX667DRAFT_508522 [Coemansia mojavensis]
MTLFVGHLTEKIKEATLYKLFEPYGTIANIDRKGTYAFIEYASKADIDGAVRDLNKKEILGSVLRVELSNRQRKDSGPPPGDLSEICYNCQQIGHIAKNCPQPTQSTQTRNRAHSQSRRNPFYSQYELESAASTHRISTQQSRLALRGGFLDEHPHKIRLVEHGNQRLQMDPLNDGYAGSSSWNKGKGKAKSRRKRTRTLEQLPLSNSLFNPQLQSIESYGIENTFESLYSPVMQSMISSGMKMANEMVTPSEVYTESSLSSHSISESPHVHSNTTLGHPSHIAMNANVSGPPTVEYPHLPPGTLVYLPAVTVLPSNFVRMPNQSQGIRPFTPPARSPPQMREALPPNNQLVAREPQPGIMSHPRTSLEASINYSQHMPLPNRPPPPPPPPPPAALSLPSNADHLTWLPFQRSFIRGPHKTRRLINSSQEPDNGAPSGSQDSNPGTKQSNNTSANPLKDKQNASTCKSPPS